MSVPQEVIAKPPSNKLNRWRLPQHITQTF